MLKKTSLVLALALLMSGCTREVYLQEVPCVDCQPCVEDTCREVQTEIQVYQVYDYAPQPVVYNPCGCTTCTAPVRNCRTVCREVPIAQ